MLAGRLTRLYIQWAAECHVPAQSGVLGCFSVPAGRTYATRRLGLSETSSAETCLALSPGRSRSNLGLRNFGLAPELPRRWILRPEFDRDAERFRSLRYYRLPYFLLGGAGPICNPFLPGYFGRQLWYDNQFSCFGTPFFGVGFYPSNFLAPALAYEPWVEDLPEDYTQQMYPSTDGGSTVGLLDMTAAIAARESAESNPSIQITQLALKDGFIFGLTDYWVEGGMLHYVTTYGAQNAIELDRIDLDKTVKLNSDRGISFVLRERPAQPPAPK